MSNFYVWKRSDGYVGCSCYMPATLNGADGSVSTFELLKEFEYWCDAEPYIHQQIELHLNTFNKG